MAQATLKSRAEYKETPTKVEEPTLLDAAVTRLAAALARIERLPVAPKQEAAADGQADLFKRENAELKAEREQLVRALDDMRQRYAQLKLVSAKVADRLDQAIERIDALVG